MHIYKCTNEHTKTQEKTHYNHRHKRIQQHYILLLFALFKSELNRVKRVELLVINAVNL